ncbi:MAG: hypothetical protein KF708_08385 [Pirellulales bacterium]|nr:hypothetical protein [Pirellulales bacterium]
MATNTAQPRKEPQSPPRAWLRGVGYWWLPLLLVAGSGASCPRVVDQYKVPVTRVLPEQPTLETVLTTINENSDRVDSLYTTSASIKVAAFPTIKANLAYEREQRFRLFAETALAGTAVDLGSNDDGFWFSAAQNNPPTIYFCRHDDFPTSPARQALSVEPTWLIEALGVVRFDPSDQHYGPFARKDGKLELRTETLDWKRITIIDPERGWILEQHAYDADGKLIASAVARNHQRDPISEAILPRTVEVHWPAMELRLTLQLEGLQINSLPSEHQLWAMPQYAGWQTIDLGRRPLPPMHDDGRSTPALPVSTPDPVTSRPGIPAQQRFLR